MMTFSLMTVPFGQDMEIYRHLPYLIETLNSFKIVSVPICDDDPAISPGT